MGFCLADAGRSVLLGSRGMFWGQGDDSQGYHLAIGHVPRWCVTEKEVVIRT